MIKTPPIVRAGRWHPFVCAELNAMIAAHYTQAKTASNQRVPLATFDWDNTCIEGDIGESVMIELDRRDGGRRALEYEKIYETKGASVAYAFCAYFLAGMTYSQVQALTHDVMQSHLLDGRIKVRQEIQDLIGALQTCGWDVWIVSASAQVLVEVFAKTYGIRHENVIGLRLEVDARGILLPQLDGPLTYGIGKVEAIQKYIGRMPDFAAGDTVTDVEMLESSRYRLLIDRGNAIARKAAEDGGWWIQPFFEK